MQSGNIKKSTIQISNAELFPHLIALMEEGHTVTLGLRGFSMRPFLEDQRDTAMMKKAERCVVGEPVLAEITPGKYVLHRLVAIDGDNVTLLGDGNLTPEHCKVSDIKAQVIGFYRKGRRKMDLVDGRKWRLYSRVWMALLPIRRYLLAIYRRWIKVFGAI